MSGLCREWKVPIDYVSFYPDISNDEYMSEDEILAYHCLLKVLYYGSVPIQELYNGS